MLTKKMPTFAHHCLAHVLSVANGGTDGGETEVWAGPLVEGAWVVGLLNTGAAAATISVDFSSFEVEGIGNGTTFCIRDLWARKDVGRFTGNFTAPIGSHDIGIFKLTVCS